MWTWPSECSAVDRAIYVYFCDVVQTFKESMIECLFQALRRIQEIEIDFEAGVETA